MALNEQLVQQIANTLDHLTIAYQQKKMFGGVAFMIQDKMCLGVSKEFMMVRVMDAHYAGIIEEPHTEPMIFGKKQLHGFLFITPQGYQHEKDFKRWIQYGLEFAEKGELKTKKAKSKNSKQ